MIIGKMEIGPVKYNKIETTLFAQSYLFSLLIGLPVGIIVNFAFGFPTLPKQGQVPANFFGWVIMLFFVLTSLESLCLPLSLSIYTMLLKRRGLTFSLNNLAKSLLLVLVFFPVLILYVALIFSAIIVPLNYTLSGIGFIGIFWIGAVLFLPFVILFGAVLLPDSPAGKWLRRSLRKIRKVTH